MKILYLIPIFLLTYLGYSQNDKDFDKGLLFYNKFEYDSAVFYFERYKNPIVDIEFNTPSVAITHYYLGKIYKLKEDYDLALQNLIVAENIYKELQDYEYLVKTYVYIAEFYRSKYDFVLSEKYLDSAKLLIDIHNISDQTLANYYNRKAAIYTEKYSDHLTSIKYSKKVLKIAENLKDKELEASSLNEIGFAYENLNDLSAEIYYMKSLKIYEDLDNKRYQSDIINNLIRFCHKQGRFREMKPYLDKGYKISEENNYLVHKRYFSKSYSLYHEEFGDFKKALFYQKQYRRLEKDELINKWNKQIIDTERKYELDKKIMN